MANNAVKRSQLLRGTLGMTGNKAVNNLTAANLKELIPLIPSHMPDLIEEFGQLLMLRLYWENLAELFHIRCQSLTLSRTLVDVERFLAEVGCTAKPSTFLLHYRKIYGEADKLQTRKLKLLRSANNNQANEGDDHANSGK